MPGPVKVFLINDRVTYSVGSPTKLLSASQPQPPTMVRPCQRFSKRNLPDMPLGWTSVISTGLAVGVVLGETWQAWKLFSTPIQLLPVSVGIPDRSQVEPSGCVTLSRRSLS